MNTEYRKLKNLFLRQSCQDAWEDYARSIRKVNFPRWDYVILTSSNEEQARSFRSQIADRLEQGVLPGWTKYFVLPDPEGKRVGSGGATLNVLRFLSEEEGLWGDFHGRFYTERNFSFGEIVLLNLLYDIHNVSNGSLVLIDELELALHPSAQIRLLSCLKEMADEKGLTILITTHSASLIRSQKDVILLEEGNESGQIDVMYHCPPAKAIGAIGMREDTMPDIVILVEDDMAKALFMELKRKYFSYYPEQAYLDIRVLEIGGYKNVINFYVEANNYVFYDNVFVTAFMDKDVETDVIPYPQYGNQEDIQRYHDHSRFLKFLPYTPEVLLVKTYIERKQQFLQSLRAEYSNQQVDYSIAEQLDFTAYEAALPNFSNQTQYNSKIEERGSFRKKCKQVAEKIALELSQQLNITVKEVYRYSYKFAVENIPENELNVRALLAQTMKRVR